MGDLCSLNTCFRGALMDDAMILPCGHSFGGGGIQHVVRTVRLFWDYICALFVVFKW